MKKGQYKKAQESQGKKGGTGEKFGLKRHPGAKMGLSKTNRPKRPKKRGRGCSLYFIGNQGSGAGEKKERKATKTRRKKNRLTWSGGKSDYRKGRWCEHHNLPQIQWPAKYWRREGEGNRGRAGKKSALAKKMAVRGGTTTSRGDTWTQSGGTSETKTSRTGGDGPGVSKGVRIEVWGDTSTDGPDRDPDRSQAKLRHTGIWGGA